MRGACGRRAPAALGTSSHSIAENQRPRQMPVALILFPGTVAKERDVAVSGEPRAHAAACLIDRLRVLCSASLTPQAGVCMFFPLGEPHSTCEIMPFGKGSSKNALVVPLSGH